MTSHVTTLCIIFIILRFIILRFIILRFKLLYLISTSVHHHDNIHNYYFENYTFFLTFLLVF
jgi:hypothetical protein